LLVVALVTAVVPILSQLLPDRPPQVVLLLAAGIIVGPSVLDLANPQSLSLFSDLGLGYLFLLAGYEIEPRILRSGIGQRAVCSWVVSLLLATAAVSLLKLVHWVRAPVPLAIGLSTTALGTLLPIMRDKGMTHGRLVESVRANGAVGELFPVFAIALVLGVYSSFLEVGAIIAVCALGWGLIAAGGWVRGTRLERIIAATATGTGQTTVRWSLVVLVGLLVLTSKFGIDSVLGAFLSGLILRRWAADDVQDSFSRKLDTVGYGLFIPLFFVVSGMELAVRSVIDQPVRLIVFCFLLLFLRGGPVLLFFRKVLGFVDRLRLMFLTATTLPLLVALAELGVRERHMLPQNAAALVGAGMVSVAVGPLVGIRLLGPVAERLERNKSRPAAPIDGADRPSAVAPPSASVAEAPPESASPQAAVGRPSPSAKPRRPAKGSS
jgi:Kef-type K+ transport system membrane component KefB